MAIILFVLILSFLVIIHELGHYLVARKFKIRVEEFGLGYPPRALTLFQKWGTVFTLNWIPFGGFVKLEGEDGTEPILSKDKKPSKKVSEDGPFYEKSAQVRLLVILAGAIVNFVFGVIAFSIVFSFSGIPSGAIIGSTADGSPAQQIQLPSNIAITAVKTEADFSPTRNSLEVMQATQRFKGQTVTLVTTGPCEEASCGSETQEYQVYVRTAEEIPEGQGAVGIAFSADYYQFYPWYQQPFKGMLFGLEQAVSMGGQILMALRDMVVGLVTRGEVPDEVTGPVGIVHQANQSGIFSQGPILMLVFAGMLSINLAIMNVLPIPALDGGRALFIILEKIIGKHRVQKVEGYANYGGFIVLVGLIVLVTFRDIFRIVVGG